jgi:hypothetical protein
MLDSTSACDAVQGSCAGYHVNNSADQALYMWPVCTFCSTHRDRAGKAALPYPMLLMFQRRGQGPHDQPYEKAIRCTPLNGIAAPQSIYDGCSVVNNVSSKMGWFRRAVEVGPGTHEETTGQLTVAVMLHQYCVSTVKYTAGGLQPVKSTISIALVRAAVSA